MNVRIFSLACVVFASTVVFAQDEAALQQYFVGKQVVVKQDMPGTQKGADINVGRGGLDWKELGKRLKQYGVAIPKGSPSRVTALVVKKDRIEFQLDGGGFGTFGDDTNTSVNAKVTPKSDYEKDLETRIANSTDDNERSRLQRDLDRERARRERQDADNRNAAQVASQIKAGQVMQSRAQGGSRFNLRWQGQIPADQLTPDGIMAALGDYVDFNAAAGAAPLPPPGYGPPSQGQVQAGMTMDQVSQVLGPGHVMGQRVDGSGLNTVEMVYPAGDRDWHVTFVNGVVVRYAMQSR